MKICKKFHPPGYYAGIYIYIIFIFCNIEILVNFLIEKLVEIALEKYIYPRNNSQFFVVKKTTTSKDRVPNEVNKKVNIS
jgi:hypothetical protein